LSSSCSDWAVRRTPRGLHLLPLTTHVNHSHDDITFTGIVTVDGQRFTLKLIARK